MREDFIKFRDFVVNNSEDIADVICTTWQYMKYGTNYDYNNDTYISDYLYNSYDPIDCNNNYVCIKLKTKESIVLGPTLGQTLRDAALGLVPENNKKITAALVAMLEIASNGNYLNDLDKTIYEIANYAEFADQGVNRLIILFCQQNNWIIDQMAIVNSSPEFIFNQFNLIMPKN